MAHAIIVVHGVGEQQKADTVRRFSNGFIDFLCRRLHEKGIPRQALKMRVDLQAPQVSLSFDHAGEKEDFIIRETWWAKVFQPYDLLEVSLWTLWLIGDRLKEAFRVLSWNPVTWLYSLALLILMPVAALVLFALIFGLRLTLAVPVLNQPVKNLLSAMQKRAADFLVTVVGDVQVYAKDWVYSTEIWECLEEEISRLAAQEEVTDICVVGHSLGSLIAYETLSRTLSPALYPKVRLLVTVGSPLDRVYLFLEEAHRFRFESPLPDRIRWFNLYSSTDLISSRLKSFDPGPENIRVGNKPVYLFFKEHSSYWQNGEVMDAILAGLLTPVPSPAAAPAPRLAMLGWGTIASRVATAPASTSALAPLSGKTWSQAARQVAQFYLPRKLTRS